MTERRRSLFSRPLRPLAASTLLLIAASCGGAATPAGPAPTPAATYSLRGVVRSYASGNMAGARVTITDGPNAGLSATTAADGSYQVTLISGGGFTAKAEAQAHVTSYANFELTPDGPAKTWDVSMVPTETWTRRGTGPISFELPRYVRRVHLEAKYAGTLQRFIVKLEGREWVNRLLGTAAPSTTVYGESRVYAGSAIIEILESEGVDWYLLELR